MFVGRMDYFSGIDLGDIQGDVAQFFFGGGISKVSHYP